MQRLGSNSPEFGASLIIVERQVRQDLECDVAYTFPTHLCIWFSHLASMFSHETRLHKATINRLPQAGNRSVNCDLIQCL